MSDLNKQKKRAPAPFTRQFESKNRIRSSHLQQTSKLNYCRFLATRSYNCFCVNYDFTPGAVADLQSLLNSHLRDIPYSWDLYQIETGITRIIETFIKDRCMQRRRTEHISI